MILRSRTTGRFADGISLRLGFLAGWLAAVASLAAAEPPSREQLTRAVDVVGRLTDPQLRQQTGWETVRALAWRIEVERPEGSGSFVPADARGTFHHGQRFRLAVEAYCDLFLYVLVRNADGSEVMLLPERNEQTPRIAKGRTIVLPGEGSSFRFDPPAGREQLRLIASPVELTWVTSRELFLVQNGQELNAQQRVAFERFRENRTRSIAAARESQQKLPQVQSLSEAVRAIEQGKLTKGCDVVAVDASVAGNLVLAASGDRNSRTAIVHDIMLKHE